MATYIGTTGNDTKTSGFDYLYGLDGNDRLAATAVGLDVVDGGRGNDFLYFGSTNASTYGAIYGGDGTDSLFGYRNGDKLYGGEGSDFITGGYTVGYPTGGNVALPGGVSGNDYIEGGDGTDAMYGFDGDDRIYGGDGDDAGTVTTPSFTYYTNTSDVIVAKAGLFGGSGSDYLDGGDGNDVLDGGADADRMLGGDGNDVLDGGTGADRMSGGDGNDTYFVDNSGDKVTEARGEGVDFVSASVDYTLGQGQRIETLSLTGSANLDATGNEFNNNLFGNSGDNTLTGGIGKDMLFGGAGADTFVYETLADSTKASSGRDVISDFSRAQGDDIDLSAIDANAGVGGNQAFRSIGANSFSHHAGELQVKVTGANTTVSADVNGDARADFSILLNGHINLHGNDFVL